MSELEPVSDELVVPLTGELVSLSDPRQVVHVLDQVREMKRKLDDVRRVLEDALRAESERQGTKTLHVDGLVATISGGSKTEYDIEGLLIELMELGLPAERLDALVVTTITQRVDQRVAKQVAGANPEYAEVIERHSSTVPDAWKVYVRKG